MKGKSEIQEWSIWLARYLMLNKLSTLIGFVLGVGVMTIIASTSNFILEPETFKTLKSLTYTVENYKGILVLDSTKPHQDQNIIKTSNTIGRGASNTNTLNLIPKSTYSKIVACDYRSNKSKGVYSIIVDTYSRDSLRCKIVIVLNNDKIAQE
ncbi:hypothetical protein WDZ92_48470, partial [Nostoc sp. NIES-2111]